MIRLMLAKVINSKIVDDKREGDVLADALP